MLIGGEELGISAVPRPSRNSVLCEVTADPKAHMQ